MRFHTFSYTSINWVHENWYKNSVKVIPHNIHEYLTPIALAIWTINNGARVGKSIKWCTNGFTYEDCIRLSIVINNLYNIKTSVQSAGKANQYHIYVFVDSIDKLRQILKPFIVNSILYKLGELSFTNKKINIII